MITVDMEEDGYVYKGRAVAVEVVVHERFSLYKIDETFYNFDDNLDFPEH